LLREIGQELGWGEASLQGFDFLDDGVEGKTGEPATSITIPYSGVSFAEYTWDPGAQAYRRWTARQPHLDAVTGEQLAASNVILLFTESWLGWEIIPDPNVISLRFRLTGEGQAFLFRDGQVYDGKWLRDGSSDSVHFVDSSGHPFLMRPGNVWVQVVTQDVTPTWAP
jgi:hypothetical protein